MGASRGRQAPPGPWVTCSPLAEKASWSGEQPQFWSKAQVLDWISYQVEKNKIDASAIDFSRCDMDGATLCSCAPEELRLVFGPLGDQLYSQLWDMSECRPGARAPSQSGWSGGQPPVPARGSARPQEGPGAPGRGPWPAGAPGARGPEFRFLSASSFPDELSWIIELLEKDSGSLQEPLGELGPAGESFLSARPPTLAR